MDNAESAPVEQPSPDAIDERRAAKVAATIAAALGETEEYPLEILTRLVMVLGEDMAQTLLAETQQIEADGGMLTDDKERRRTPGGVFFKLTKNKVKTKIRHKIFGKPEEPPKPEPLLWEEIAPAIPDIIAKPGEASTAKMSIVGRPGRIVEKGDVIITSMQNSEPPSLPRGLPIPPPDKTTYIVYIVLKQWRKVRNAIKNTEDRLIVEGYPTFDRRLGQAGAMTVYAQNTTTVLLQRQLREKQQAEAAQKADPG